MSRAFVREIEDPHPLPMPERPVSRALNLVTPRGARLIEETVNDLQKRIAGANMDVSDLRRDLRYWSARRSTMQIVPVPSNPATIEFGVRATIFRRGHANEICIVGEDESDPAAGRIAWTAPLARALKGARVGETVEFKAAGHVETITVLAIAAGDPHD